MKRIRTTLKNQKLIFQIGILLVILFIGATIGNVFLIYRNNMNMYLDEVSEEAANIGSYAAKSMEDIDGIEWLVTYWSDNAEKLDIIYDSPKDTKKKGREFCLDYPQYELGEITMEDIDSMAEDAKKRYSEYMYMKLTDDFNRMKRTYHPAYIYCFLPISDTKLLYFMTGTEEGDREKPGGNVYVIGTLTDYDEETFPVLVETWEKGELIDKLEQPIKTGKFSGYYQRFIPVVKDGKCLCLIGVTQDTNTIQKEIRSKIMIVELIEIAVFILMGIIIFYVVSKLFIKPIAKIEKSMKEYEKDKDAKKVEERLKTEISKSEIGQLTKEFTELTQAIERHVKEIAQITSEQEKLKAELSLAASIQSDMLPKDFLNLPELEIYGSMQPAKEVGGDFYDFFEIDNDHIAIVIGDVSGKGVPASLFMVRSMMAIRNYTVMGADVDQVFAKVNNELCRGNESELFTTSWMGVYEISTGKLVYTEAGHDDPFCIRCDGRIENISPTEKSLVLGGFEDMPYTLCETHLAKGETILLYTDGLPEANDVNGNQYGMDRIEESLREHRTEANTELKEFVELVKKDVFSFASGAEQFDDLTLLALTIK